MMRTMGWLLRSVARLGLPLFLIWTAPASGATITWIFEGVVRDYGTGQFPNPFPAEFVAAGVEPGAPLTAVLTFTDGQPDRLPGDPTTGVYDDSLLSAVIDVGDLTLTMTQAGAITAALDRTPVPPSSDLTSLYRILSPLFALDVTGGSFTSDFFGVDLVDSGQDVITSDAFPLLPPDLADLDAYNIDANFVTAFVIRLDGPSEGSLVWAEITSLVVPEPGTGLLVGLGLVLTAIRARRSQHCRAEPPLQP